MVVGKVDMVEAVVVVMDQIEQIVLQGGAAGDGGSHGDSGSDRFYRDRSGPYERERRGSGGFR